MAKPKANGASAASPARTLSKSDLKASSKTSAPPQGAQHTPKVTPSQATRAPLYNSPMVLVPIFALFAVLASLTVFLHYRLPTPISSLQALESTAKPLFSEENALSIMEKLSSEFGYRIVGTKQHVDAEDWLMTELQKYEGVHTFNDGQGDVQVEVWKQIGDGAHR